MEITKREIIASIAIVAIMLLIGLVISSKISDWQIDQNEKYNEAVKIEDPELFQYGIDTNVGNAFVYGDLEAVDTVIFPEIDGEYLLVRKITERYTMHTRTVEEYDEKGNISGSHQETYWTWDEIGRELLHSRQIRFCGVVFDYGKIDIPLADYITTIRQSSDLRDKFYGVAPKHTGTIFTELRDSTISDGSNFYKGKTIQETVDMLENGVGWQIAFWMGWILLSAIVVCGFYYLDNRWLEDA